MTEQEKQYAREVAQTALNQLGHGLKLMIGMKNLLVFYDKDNNVAIHFDFARNKSGANHCAITYLEGPDLYRMEFTKNAPRITAANCMKPREYFMPKSIKVFDEICFDQLQPLFEQITQLYTRLW